MPLLDLPLDQLKKYTGRNPRPADFDDYWSDALHQLDKLGAAYTLEPAAFKAPQAEAFHLWFMGVGGARIHAKFLRPKNFSGTIPGVCAFHGYTWHSGNWQDQLALVAQGMAVASLDVRGQGGLSEDNLVVKGMTHGGHIIRGVDDPNPHNLFFRNVFLDCAHLARILMEMPEVDAGRIGATGGSQGGGLTLACAALEPRVKLAAPVMPFLCDYQRVWEMDLAKHAYGEIREYFTRFDPQHFRQEAFFERLGYIDLQHLASRIKAEVLWGTGLMDNICPPSTQFAAYNKITSSKNMRVFPDNGHENLSGFPDEVFEFLCAL